VRRLLVPIGLLVLVVIGILVSRYSVHVTGARADTATAKPQPDAIPSCSGALSTPPPAQVPGGPKLHSVTLSWDASIPTSASPGDAIRGYYVFRSLKSKSYAESDRINKFPLTGTQCVDATVAPKTTYYYVVKAVAQSGVQSVVSEEIKAVIPLP
jgi:hypothetical protein